MGRPDGTAIFGFSFFFFFKLFIHDREREREREAGSVYREPDVGLDSESLGSHPGPEAVLNPKILTL